MPLLARLSSALRIAALATLCATPSRAADSKSAAATEPWNAPAFSADPAALLAAASARPRPENAEVELLLEEFSISIDAQGRRMDQYRMIFRPLTEKAARDWATFSTQWSPWNEERPQMRARIVTAQGAVHELDPATMGDAPDRENDDDQFTDRRRVRGPLPALGAGSVVEEMTTTRETAPAFASGARGSIYLSRFVPVHVSRFVVEAPEGSPLRVRAFGPGPQPKQSHSGAKVRFELTRVDAPASPEVEPLLPPEATGEPYLVWSTGSSWQAAAAEYAAIVDRQLKAGPIEVPPIAGLSRAAAIRRLVARVHEVARYTGVEFGEAAIVPRTPREVLARGYGDCKDLAALLVAMLRAAGIPAQIALIHAGRLQISEDLPSLGAFDHAIVHVAAGAGEPELWIDATAASTPAGQLPLGDQGQLALIADPATRALVRTGEAQATNNTDSDSIDIFVAEEGPARVEQVLQGTGALDVERRQRIAGQTAVQVREGYQRAVLQSFNAEELTVFDVSEVADLERPVRVKVAVAKSRIAVASLADAEVTLSPGNVLRHVPDELLGDEQKAKPRKSPAHLWLPHVQEMSYRVHVPVGLSLRELPANATTPMGAATLREEYTQRESPDGLLVEAKFRLEVPRRWTAPQVEALRGGLASSVLGKPLVLRFDVRGKTLLTEGRLREAIAEYRRLVALHPQESQHHLQLAYALLAANAGDEAREEARAAVALAPAASLPRVGLAYVLEHDRLGRLHMPGYDAEGAIAAYREALKIAPKATLTRRALAELLELGSNGKRFGPGARFAEASALYQQVRKDDKDADLGVALLIDLLYARQFAEARAEALSAKPSQVRNAALLIVAAAHDGGAAALAEARKLSPGDRQGALQMAADTLVQLRMYSLAAELYDVAASGSTEAPRLAAMSALARKLRPRDQVQLPPNEPLTLLKEFFSATVETSPAPEKLRKFFVARAASEELTPRKIFARRQAVTWTGFPAEVLSDAVYSALEAQVEGDARQGFRVHVMGTPAQRTDSLWFVTSENGALKVVCVAPCRSGLAAEALARAERGDLAGAQRWLNWAHEGMPQPYSSEPGYLAAVDLAWPQGGPRTAVEVKLAAAVIASDSADSALPILRAARDEAQAPAGRATFGYALASALLDRQRAADALVVAEAATRDLPDSRSLLVLRAAALALLHRWEDLRKLGQDRLAAHPEDLAAQAALGDAATGSGDLDEADRLSRKRIELAGDDAWHQWNSIAWHALVRSRVDEAALDAGRRAADLSKQHPAATNTLAALYAEVGRQNEARAILRKIIEEKPETELDDGDWYLVGRVAEGDGLGRSALLAYRRIALDKDTGPTSVAALAKKRLAVLAAADVK